VCVFNPHGKMEANTINRYAGISAIDIKIRINDGVHSRSSKN